MRSKCLESVMDYKCVPSPLDFCSGRMKEALESENFLSKKIHAGRRKIEMKNKVNLILLSEIV